jgi:hypothetical protein
MMNYRIRISHLRHSLLFNGFVFKRTLQGDQDGLLFLAPLNVIRSISIPSAFIMKRSPELNRVELKIRCFPSGDQVGDSSSPEPSVNWASFAPSGEIAQIRSRPSTRQVYAIAVPFGDHAGDVL